jgi:glutathione S-transferase
VADTKRIVWGIGTSRTLRAHWMLHELGLDYETRPIGSRTGETQTAEFRALNPRQKIPVLQDGELTLAESAAIVSYLAETYGATSGLIPPPATPERARYYEACFFVMTELDAHTLYVIRRHRDLADLYGEAPNAISAAEAGFAKQVAVAERQIERDGPWLLGERFTGADILLASCLGWAIFYKQPLSETLSAYLRRATGRDAYRAANALNFPPEVLARLRGGAS